LEHLVNREKREYRGVRDKSDKGSQAGVNDEVRSGCSGIGVTPPEVDSTGIDACGGGPKVRRADFI
jgi:hypothetical protein